MAIIFGEDGPSNMWMRPSWRQGVFRSPRHRSPTSNNAALALEAGTLPRSTRFKWRAGTQHLPVHQPSGADGILTRSTRRWQWPLGCKKRLRYSIFFCFLADFGSAATFSYFLHGSDAQEVRGRLQEFLASASSTCQFLTRMHQRQAALLAAIQPLALGEACATMLACTSLWTAVCDPHGV